mgnify:CR=1 FL=1
MEINEQFWSTLFFTVLNILILYFILKKILFKPVTKYMSDRSNKIKEALDMAEEAKKKVEEMEKEHQARLKEVKEQGVLIMDTYKKKAENEYNSIIEKAKQDAEIMIKNTRNELEVEKEKLINDIKGEVTELVLAASKKVLNENLDEKTNKKLIQEFLNEKK